MDFNIASSAPTTLSENTTMTCTATISCPLPHNTMLTQPLTVNFNVLASGTYFLSYQVQPSSDGTVTCILDDLSPFSNTTVVPSSAAYTATAANPMFITSGRHTLTVASNVPTYLTSMTLNVVTTTASTPLPTRTLTTVPATQTPLRLKINSASVSSTCCSCIAMLIVAALTTFLIHW